MKIRPYIIYLIFLAGCANDSIYSELLKNFTILVNGPQDISQEQVDKVPYASMQARLGNSENSLIVLEEDKDNTLKWTTSNYVKIYTQKGFVIRLTGLGNELQKIDLDKNHPANLTQYPEDKIALTSFYSFENPQLFRLPVKTIFSYVKDETITILGKKIETKVFREESLKNLISWEFENKYWVNKDREIVKSIQYFSPKNPPIHLLVTKKYLKP
tara:strand:- start:199 stop:843 length:645 start_codon:yes stop_codon:yes gene_type:complete